MAPPITWSRALREGLRSGTAASVVSTLVLIACGKRERDDAAQPVNGPSQWTWGRHAPHVHGFSVRYTVTGYAIHHAMSVLWAVLFERLRPQAESPSSVAAAAGLTAAIAYNVDFGVVPTRLSPGFQAKISRRCLYATYAGFAAALAATAMLGKRRS
jgi:hypothetical protein